MLCKAVVHPYTEDHRWADLFVVRIYVSERYEEQATAAELSERAEALSPRTLRHHSNRSLNNIGPDRSARKGRGRSNRIGRWDEGRSIGIVFRETRIADVYVVAHPSCELLVECSQYSCGRGGALRRLRRVETVAELL